MKRCLTVSQEYLKHSTIICTNASTHITPLGAFFFLPFDYATHTHTHRPQAHANAKRFADRRRCYTTFRECKPNDLRPLQRRCVVLHIDKSISLSLSQGKRVGHHRVYTTPDKSTAVNRRRCIERYPPRRYFNNVDPPTTG